MNLKVHHFLLLAVVLITTCTSLEASEQKQPESRPAEKGAVTIQVQTFCVSTKSKKPPDEKCKYKVGTYPSSQALSKFRAMNDRAMRLEASGAFKEVPIHPQRRVSIVAQLAIWKEQGEKSTDSKDIVSRQSIGDDLLMAAQTPKSSLSPEQKKNFDESIRKIFEAADLTQKVGLLRTSESQPKSASSPALVEVSPCSSLDNTICGDLADKVEKGQLTVQLIGDGVSTTHVELRLFNQSDLPMLVSIKEGQIFVPESEEYQFMMVREGTSASLPPSGSVDRKADKSSARPDGFNSPDGQKLILSNGNK